MTTKQLILALIAAAIAVALMLGIKAFRNERFH